MELEVLDLGLIEINEAYKFQQETFGKIKRGLLKSALILCQHYPVITIGRQGNRNNILVSEAQLKEKQISIYTVERGGDVTYHGPGQLTVYPIFNLSLFKKDIHWFLRQLEEVLLKFLSDFGVGCQRRAGFTGVWVAGKKIASIGIAIRNWITFHGLSLNIKRNDLDNFNLIRPCGMDIKMTSLETVLEASIEIDEIKTSLIRVFRPFLNPIVDRF